MSVVPRIAVVIPAYNHASYVAQAIRSVLDQNWPNIALYVLDDGSTDDTYREAERALSESGLETWRLESQENEGSARALNRLIARCDSDYVAILNSDDRYLIGRLAAFVAKARQGEDFLGFSGVAFDPAAMISPTQTFESWYRGNLAYALSLPTCGFALVAVNLAISSSNLFFSRGLFDRVDGFNPELPLTQDWEFLLKALRWTEAVFIPERLLYYRVHANNSFKKLAGTEVDQSRKALGAYIGWAHTPSPNLIAPTPMVWQRFFPLFAGSCAPAFSADPVGNFLPADLLAQPAQPGHCAVAESAAALNLVQASRHRTENLRKGTEALMGDVATFWDGIRALVIGNG